MPPIKLAIVGAGPSSFYVASRLLSLLPHQPSAPRLTIHMYDRLWAPHGLVRYGVAPDHPEVKNCTHKFDETAKDPRIRFFGNVNVTSSASNSSMNVPHALQLPLASLLPHYTHLLLSTGCTLPTFHPSLPPSAHCIPALSLVHWYTQHPSVAHRPPPPLERAEHVSVIGQGNVALDVARMLLTPSNTLSRYDVPESVLSVLRRSAVRHVSVLGRRGPYEAAFTAKEVREMMGLEGVAMVPIEEKLLAPAEGKEVSRQQSRIIQLLRKGSVCKLGTTEKTWSLDFFRSPAGMTVSPSDTSARPVTLDLEHTTLSPSARAIPTGETSALKTSLVITSLGHRAEPETPWYDPEKSHVRNVGGRVVDEDGRLLRGVYASGWAARGAHGVLATTMMDAYQVAANILSDAFPGEYKVDGETPAHVEGALEVLPREVNGDVVPREVEHAVKEGMVTDYEQWKRVDEEEVRRGELVGKERERMSWEEARTFLARTKM